MDQKSGVCNNEENSYGNYASLEVAQKTCFEDIDCIAVQDDGCDNIGSYRLCKNGFVRPSSSCIYPKKVHTGMS